MEITHITVSGGILKGSLLGTDFRGIMLIDGHIRVALPEGNITLVGYVDETQSR